MLVNLVPEFLAVRAAPDPLAAYHEYLERHRPVLASYWHNYVLDPASPHAEQVVLAALHADRTDLRRLLEDVDVVAIAEEALQRALDLADADCPVDLYLMGGGRAGLRALGVLRLHATAVPAHPGARRVPAAGGRSPPRRDGAGPPAALPLGRAQPGGPARRGQGAAGAVWLLPRCAAGRELSGRAGSAVHAARQRAGVPPGGGARPGDPERVSPKPQVERRHNRPLREVLDELLQHTRDIARRAKEMTPQELEYSQQRLEWLADEVWRGALGREPEP